MFSARIIPRTLAVLLGATFTACHAQSRSTDTLVIAQTSEPQSLNPLLHIDYNAYALDNLVFSMLLQQDSTGRLVPDLATNVPSRSNGQISADGRRILYHLRRGLQWQDGKPLTSGDIAFTYKAIMNPRTAVPSRAAYESVDRIETPDARTIIVCLKRRFAPFLNSFLAPGQGYPVLPAHLLSRYTSLNTVPFNNFPIGSGPYRVKRWSRSDRLELEANLAYFAGVPRIKHLVIRYIPNGATIVEELRTGETDAYFMADPSEVESVKASTSLALHLHSFAGVQELLMNTRARTLRDKRVRSAIALSLHLPYIARTVGHGLYSARDARRGQFFWAFDPRVPGPRFDPVAADNLLDDAGWIRGRGGMRFKDRRPLIVDLAYRSGRPADATISLLVQQDARARGITVQLKAYRSEQYVAPAKDGGPLLSGHFEMGLIDGGFPDPDVSNLYSCAAVAPRGYNISRYCNPAMDAALQAATSTFELGARMKAYAIVQRFLSDDVPSVLMWQDQEIDLVPSRLRGFAPSVTSPFYNASLWKLSSM